MVSQNEQYELESFYHLALCCRSVGEKFGKADITLWTNGDYLKLSSVLFYKTNVRISPSTLKRIFGKLKTTERYYPQKATRDALANYAGFKDWQSFIEKHPKPQQNETIQRPVNKKIGRKKNSLLIVLIMLAILSITIWRFLKKENRAPVNLEDIKLVCKNPIGGNPHSAEFTIELPKKFKGDSANFSVNFDDGKMEKRELGGTLFTYYFEIPGRYYPVLKYNGVPIDTAIVYLKTDGWTATAVMEHDTTRVYPVNNHHLFKNGNLKVNGKELFQAGVDTDKTFFVHFVNTKPLNISGDNFELTADVITSPLRPGVRCSQIYIEVYGEKSKDEVLLIKPGCVSWAFLSFSEIIKDGKKSDLSSLGVDLSQGGVVKLRVVDKKVSLQVNNIVLYKTTYNFSLEKIYGVKIAFAGIGSINNLVLKDLRTNTVFHEGFASATQ